VWRLPHEDFGLAEPDQLHRLLAEASLCGASTIRRPEMSMLWLLANALMR